jgi:Bacteriocin-protection, YdeI or OmpD-Associated/Domain of unknown function (DUF1905)
VQWGPNTYTILRVPVSLVAAATEAGTRRVEGTIDDVSVNLALTSAPVVEGHYLWAGRSLQHQLDVHAGDVVQCRLRPADPDEVPIAQDVSAALADAGRTSAWMAVRPTERRARLARVDAARRPETRARRIAELVAEL